MTKACIVVPDAYQKGRLFDLENPVLNRDNCLLPFHELKERMYEQGIELNTHDRFAPEECQFVLFNEMPLKAIEKSCSGKKILMLFETEAIRPVNWMLSRHPSFNVILTWDDRLAGSENYIKFNFPNYLPIDVEKKALSPRDKLCTMIVGNKVSANPLELYSERASTIQWFEKHQPESFDLYGIGWDSRFYSGLLRPLNRIPTLKKVGVPKRPSYKGTATSKIDILTQYKFAICYENISETPGYITEKIFDCLMAGTIPVYWGAPNIAEYIPASCFIDRTQFENHDDLYRFISNISDIERRRYVEAAIDFLHSPGMYPFSIDCFCDTVLNAIER